MSQYKRTFLSFFIVPVYYQVFQYQFNVTIQPVFELGISATFICFPCRDALHASLLCTPLIALHKTHAMRLYKRLSPLQAHPLSHLYYFLPYLTQVDTPAEYRYKLYLTM